MAGPLPAGEGDWTEGPQMPAGWTGRREGKETGRREGDRTKGAEASECIENNGLEDAVKLAVCSCIKIASGVKIVSGIKMVS